MNIYTKLMNTSLTPQSLIEQILQIQQMEHGSISVVRDGPNRPYYNLNSWEQGRNCCRYLPHNKVPAVQHAIAGYQKYQQLTEAYAQQIINKTRTELCIAVKKKSRRRPKPYRPESSPPKKPNLRD